jgi:WD40 repeat protein
LSNGNLVNCDFSQNINVWNVITNSLVQTIHTTVNHVGVQQIGSYLATCDYDGIIYLWNSADLTFIRSITGIAQQRFTLAALNNSYLVSASRDGYLQAWTVPAGVCLSTFNPFQREIKSMIFISNNTLALTGGIDHVLIVQVNPVTFAFHVTKTITTVYWIIASSVALTNANILLTGNLRQLEYYYLTNSTSLSLMTYSMSTVISYLAAPGIVSVIFLIVAYRLVN